MALFINYRREDSEGDARAIYNWLSEKTDKGNIFLDFDSIAAGDNWRNKIDETLNNVQAVLVVIGPRWLDILKQREGASSPDLVRREIALSLQKPGVQVIPVTVKGAVMPPADALPDDIRGLADRNAKEVRGSAWQNDARELYKVLRKAKALPVSRRVWWLRTLASVFAILFSIAAVYRFVFVEVPDIPKNTNHKVAKQIIERSGLKFKAAEPNRNYATGVDVVESQYPSAGARLFPGQSVEVALTTKALYHLVCKAGGMLKNPTKDRTLVFDKHVGGDLLTTMMPGTCSWRDRLLRESETPILKPLGVMDELMAAFDRAPGGLIELCVFSEYPEPVTQATRSLGFVAVDYNTAAIENFGNLEWRTSNHLCDDRYVDQDA